MSRQQKDKDKALQEKHHALLAQLLRDEDNKYCVDCDAKGPRWASWNLGIFLCIRCAGIHRNLGVHISRVKSVNLDSWTPEQMQMVQEMGNSRARAVYEANLPDDFRRPQTDSSLEIFIREKYEKKKYIAKEWIPPQLKSLSNTEEKKEKKKPKPKPSSQIQLNSSSSASRPKSNTSSSSPLTVPKATKQPPPIEKKPSAAVDLLGLDNPSPAANNATSNNSDLFGDFLSAPQKDSSVPNQPELQGSSNVPVSDDSLLFGDAAPSSEKPKSTKESIMALYGSGGPNQAQMFGVPGTSNPASTGSTNYYEQGGMYMPQQHYGMMQNGVVAPQNNTVPNQYNIGMMTNMQVSQAQQQQQPQAVMMNQQMMGNAPPGGNMPMMQGQMNMYGGQAQQQHLQQIQQQMASMKLNNPGMMGVQQQAPPVAAGPMGWGGQTTGQTLSTNLWQ